VPSLVFHGAPHHRRGGPCGLPDPRSTIADRIHFRPPVARRGRERARTLTRVTILGAGDMGTALATPLAQNGHQVHLWGTERDTEIVAALRAGQPHPRLKVALPAAVRVFAAEDAPNALAGADIVVIAITSDAVRPIVARLAPSLGAPAAIVTVAKGFDADDDGTVHILPTVIARSCPAPVVAVGGPSKANEVARGLPTAVVFGGTDTDTGAVARCRDTFATPGYRIETTADIIGLEVAAAMKNAYAIALGVADGLERATGQPHHNLRAALFPRAVAEMACLAESMGGRRETVTGLAGSGDLQVTITSGRNRLLGERIGAGEAPGDAIRALSAAGTTIEGYPAADYGHRLAAGLVAAAALSPTDLPLLDALWRILYAAAPPQETLWQAAAP
jgi:glycerol-3-phosphate dehydrogenase (NAD(P)+)